MIEESPPPPFLLTTGVLLKKKPTKNLQQANIQTKKSPS